MLILPMAAASSHVPPPVSLEESNDLADFHLNAPLSALYNVRVERRAAPAAPNEGT